MKRHTAIENVVAPAVEGLGYEFVGLEYIPQGKFSTLRIYIDQPNGVNIDDCEKVSRNVSSVLEVETQLARGAYNLEVSSPGIDRKIFSPEQFPKYVGKQIHVKLHALSNGHRNITATLVAVTDTDLELDVNGAVLKVDLANIAHANVVDKVMG